MIDLYKGYIKTENGKSKELFTVFDLKSIEDIKSENLEEYSGVLNDGTVCIIVNRDKYQDGIINIIKKYNMKCKILMIRDEIHILFKMKDGDSFLNGRNTLFCGIDAIIKTGDKNALETVRANNEDAKTVFDAGTYENIPLLLYPMNMHENFDNDNFTETILKHFAYIIKKHGEDKAEEIGKVARDYFIKKDFCPRDIIYSDKMRTLTEPSKDDFFTKKGEFLFDKFANFLVDKRKIIKINNQLHIYKDGVYVKGNEWIEREMINKIPHLTKSKRKEVFEYLNLIVNKNMNTTDYNQYIAFKNCIYNIVDGKPIPFSDKYIITNKINWDYNPDSYSPIIDNVLNKFSNGDKKLRLILEEMIGYCFFRQNEMGKAFILVGPQANGKSTFQSMIQKLLGRENISSIDLKDLNERFMPAEFYGKLANIGDDIGDAYIDDNNMFKTIVTGGRIIAEKKGQDPFEFEPYVKCIFSANTIPRTRDKTGAIKRRLIIIPFDRIFSPKDKDYDPYIGYKIKNGTEDCSVDDNMSYLINIGLQGLERVLSRNAFTESDKVNEKINEYDKENNPIKVWFEELGTKEEAREEINGSPVQDVYNRYCDFCESSGLKKMTKIEFGKSISKEFGLKGKVYTIDGRSVRLYIDEKILNR